MLYAQTLEEGATFGYYPRTFKGTVTLKTQVGHRCTVVDEAGKEFDVSCDDLGRVPVSEEPK